MKKWHATLYDYNSTLHIYSQKKSEFQPHATFNALYLRKTAVSMKTDLQSTKESSYKSNTIL